jgi:octopine/nopaline transport system permease protein
VSDTPATLITLLGWGASGWLDELVLATLLTLLVALAAMAWGMGLGALVAAAAAAPQRGLAAAARAYVGTLRALPELLVIYLLYFGASVGVSRLYAAFGGSGFVEVPAFFAATLAIGLVSAAYQAEVFRGALAAVDAAELEAAAAVGMSRALRLRRVLVPQVLRYALPALGNSWQVVLKESALVAVVGLTVHWQAAAWWPASWGTELRFHDLLRQSQVAAGATREPFVFFAAAAALYGVLTLASGQVLAAAQRRLLRGWKVAAGAA